tara:strand:- start:312 stop:509 length:198 start_codon:yes stop_codon:yes gene_type:complete
MAKMPMKKDPKTGKMMPAFMAKKKNGNGKTKNGTKKNGNGMNGLTAAQKKLPKALQAAILKKKKK